MNSANNNLDVIMSDQKLLPDIIDPFNINLLRLDDQFNTVFGFEFLYSGIEKHLCRDDIDLFALKIHDENVANHIECNEHYPTHDCYLHKKYRIEVSKEENSPECKYDKRFTVYRIRVIEVYDRMGTKEGFERVTTVWYDSNIENKVEKFDSSHMSYYNYYPKYVIEYADRLAKTIDSVVAVEYVEKNFYKFYNDL